MSAACPRPTTIRLGARGSRIRRDATLTSVFPARSSAHSCPLVWYGLMPAFVGGLVHAIRRQLGDILPILVFAVTLTLAYALMQGNVGTAYRQRTQVTMFFFLFMGVGLVERAKQKALRGGGRVMKPSVAAMTSWRRRLRLAGLALVGLLPNVLKRPFYRGGVRLPLWRRVSGSV